MLTRELTQMMIAGIPPSTTLADGLASAFVCFAIDEALRTHSVVDLTPWWQRAGIPLYTGVS